MNIYEDAVTLADQLSIAEKVRLIEHLGSVLRHDLEVEAFRRMPWHEFVERTASILADTRLSAHRSCRWKNVSRWNTLAVHS